MVDSTHLAASLFLWLAGFSFLFVFALPLLIAPYTWARWLLWPPEPESNLGRYFGRCVGGLAVANIVVVFRAAPAPAENPIVFELIAAVGALLTGVHVWGAITARRGSAR